MKSQIPSDASTNQLYPFYSFSFLKVGVGMTPYYLTDWSPILLLIANPGVSFWGCHTLIGPHNRPNYYN